jgi:hypothetical protein
MVAVKSVSARRPAMQFPMTASMGRDRRIE